jgi:hypothetical protein
LGKREFAFYLLTFSKKRSRRGLAARDRRVIAEINQIGRRAYAQHLVDKQGIDPKSKYYATREYSPTPKPSPFDDAINNAIAGTHVTAHNDNIFKKAA